MEIKKEEKQSSAIKIIIEENNVELGHAYLYLIYNDLQQGPYGFLEDVFVQEAARGRGIGTRVVQEIIIEAKKQGCNKLIGNSRYSRPQVHEWYIKLGFKDYGKEFRMDF